MCLKKSIYFFNIIVYLFGLTILISSVSKKSFKNYIFKNQDSINISILMYFSFNNMLIGVLGCFVNSVPIPLTYEPFFYVTFIFIDMLIGVFLSFFYMTNYAYFLTVFIYGMSLYIFAIKSIQSLQKSLQKSLINCDNSLIV